MKNKLIRQDAIYVNEAEMFNEDGTQMTEDEIWEDCAKWLEDERVNLYKPTNGEIICIAMVERWDGKHIAYKQMGHNVANILRALDGGFCKWEGDERNVIGTESHHDGVNHYVYRELKGNTYDEQMRNLDKLFNGKPINNRRIGCYTKSILPYAKEVYGW